MASLKKHLAYIYANADKMKPKEMAAVIGCTPDAVAYHLNKKRNPATVRKKLDGDFINAALAGCEKLTLNQICMRLYGQVTYTDKDKARRLVNTRGLSYIKFDESKVHAKKQLKQLFTPQQIEQVRAAAQRFKKQVV